MSRRKRDREPRERYYLLPGQGGRAYRRKQRFILAWAVVAAFAFAALVALVLYLVNESKRF